MARKKENTPTIPEPIAVQTICSVCGLDWNAHGKDPSTDDCIRLLQAELAKATSKVVIREPYAIREPLRPPWWREWYYGQQPVKSPPIIYGTTTTKANEIKGISEHTPRLLSTTVSGTTL